MKNLAKTDPEIARLVKREETRQQETLMMIPSENIASRAVEEAVGSVLGNKYAEGYPYKRYYQGQENVDQIEQLVVDRAKKLFKVSHVNVQPYSGSPANFAVYTALLAPGDTIMGLSLAAGGHLTHGASRTASSIYFHSVQYGVDRDGLINFDALMKLARLENPKIIVAGTTAYPRILEWKKFREVADAVGAYLLADISHITGLIIGGAHPSPVPYADIIMTTTHKTLRGPRGAMLLVTARGLKTDPQLDKKIDSAVFPGLQGGPHMNTIAGIGVALKEASTSSFQNYAKQIVKNAKALAVQLKDEGVKMVAGGTDNHLILIDLQDKEILGNTAAEACEAVGIILNRNAVPYDPNPPFYPSGLRLGTPGVTSRKMKEKEMKKIGELLGATLRSISETKKGLGFGFEDEKKKLNRKKIIDQTKELAEIKKQILRLCKEFPV